jgi:hypothetical protein
MIAEDVKRDFNERLRAKKLSASRWTIGVNRLERLLGKELLVLAWAVENASQETVPNAIRNWIGLRPEERWWLYSVTAAATGFPEHADIGWRKALRFALTENPLAEALTERNADVPRGPQKGKRKEGRHSESLLLFESENEEQSPFIESKATSR